jgi:hypothetical protein
MPEAQIRELARYLAASYIAWQLGYKSVDYVLRTKIPKKVPAHWLAFAEECHARMNPRIGGLPN